MKNSKILFYSFVHSLGVVIYTALVSWLLTNGEVIFGKMTNFWGPLAMLLLFMVSATITGSLVLLKPIYLYLGNAKKEAVQFLLCTIAWLAIFMSVILGILLIV